MNKAILPHPLRKVIFLLSIFILASCSNVLREVVKEPEVSVEEFKLIRAGLINQTFALVLSISNPNPVSLPVKSFQYTISLAGDEFATGNTTEPFSIPAGGNEKITIDVKLNLLRSSSHLVNIIKSGSQDINYEVKGNVAVDLPLMSAVPINKTGTIKLNP